MELLFSYGTLQQKNVQIANFGRELVGTADTLPNYRVGEIRITDERVLRESGKAFHPILKYTGNPEDQVMGTVFQLTTEELLQADNYEVDDYQRISAVLKSGCNCWIYAAAKNAS
ncbi:MAG: gamma-glutamylcyclotransferase [Porticoccaceae bacterium]|nr:gamma-glutamylcyclotransferase [Porticoccaceae bacterium]